MNEDDEVLVAWLNARGFRVDHDNSGGWGATLRRPTKINPTPYGVAVEAEHLDLYLSDYVMTSREWTGLTLRDANDQLAINSLRDVVRTWMLGLNL